MVICLGFTFLVLAYLGSPGQRAAKWVRVLSLLVNVWVFFGLVF